MSKIIGEKILRERSSDEYDLSEQWEFVNKIVHSNDDCQKCDLCNHRITNEIVLYNRYTKKHLRTGKDCASRALGNTITYNGTSYPIDISKNIEAQVEKINTLIYNSKKNRSYDAILDLINEAKLNHITWEIFNKKKRIYHKPFFYQYFQAKKGKGEYNFKSIQAILELINNKDYFIKKDENTEKPYYYFHDPMKLFEDIIKE